jgi:hypothetical protein
MIKKVFGFDVDAKVEASGMQRMALLIHGKRIVDMIGSTIAVLGPDTESLKEVLSEMGSKNMRDGFKPEYFQHLGQAFREVLQGTLGELWMRREDEAWEDFFAEVTLEITKAVVLQ